MATRMKTVKYSFPVLASLTNNTLTNVPQTTLYIPESSPSFKSVVAHVTMDDIVTVTGGTVTTKTLALRLGAASYTTIANANARTNSGENVSHWFSADFTSQFTSNWSGTFMTCDFQTQINQTTGTTTGMVNVCVTLDITYTYDDTSATHIKTVMIPLDAPTVAIPATATTYDTIPALDSYLPEASKTYRNIFIVLQGNTSNNGVATNNTVTLTVGSTSQTTTAYAGALASDRFYRYVYDVTSTYPSTAATQTWKLTSSVTRMNHPQAYMVVTYEFSPGTTTSVMNSLMIPMELASPMGGVTASDYQRGTRELWIQEPGTITTNRVAFYPFWQQIAAISTLNMRVGTGPFVAYTDVAAAVCGSNASMVRNDGAFTLAKGRNNLNFDVWRSDTVDFGWNLSGFWIINYTSDLAASGIGSHNHTIDWGLTQNGTTAASTNYTVAATAPSIPESDYFIGALGTQLYVITSGTVAASGYTVLIERLAGEGGIQWEPAYIDSSQSDPEIGTFLMFSQMRTSFKRWIDDPDPGRMDVTTSRRWRVHINGSTAVIGWVSLGITMTYHSIISTVADSISGFSGTVKLGLHRSDNNVNSTGELVKATTRSGDGSFSFSWYDTTEDLFVSASDGTTTGRSTDGKAS